MPKTIEELAKMIAERDNVSIAEAKDMISVAAVDMETAFMNGSLDDAERILGNELGLELDYLMLFIN